MTDVTDIQQDIEHLLPAHIVLDHVEPVPTRPSPIYVLTSVGAFILPPL